MSSFKPTKPPLANTAAARITRPDTLSPASVGLSALLQLPPKRLVIESRKIVASNKSDILKALRRGHRVEDIAKALSIPNRTFVRRLSELNISARLVRKQYQRLS